MCKIIKKQEKDSFIAKIFSHFLHVRKFQENFLLDKVKKSKKKFYRLFYYTEVGEIVCRKNGIAIYK